MAIEEIYPAVRPSLDLNFARSKSVDPRITFTRASGATYYGGVTVAKAEENLFSYSQDFANAVWTKNEVSVTTNLTSAPDGTATATLQVPSTVNISHSVSRSPSLSGQVTLSCFSKASGYNFLELRFGGSTVKNAYFDVSSGTVGSVDSGVTATIQLIGGGWYRCTATFTVIAIGDPAVIGVCAADNTRSFAGNGTSGIYIWGAQLEQRSQVTAYTPTTTQPITNYIPVLQTAPANVPRIDHDPVTGECKGLLIEEQRTNFLKQSEDISQVVWLKQRTSVIAGYVSPFGSLAGKLVPSTDLNNHLLSQSFLSSAGTYTLSAYVKAGEYSRFQLFLNDSTTGSAGVNVNLAAKTASVTTSGSWTNTSVFINELTNGWFRVGVTGTQGAGTGVSCVIIMYDNTQNSVFAGDGFSGIYVTGLQVEAGSFPTSYIKTVAEQVTRAADSASMTGANFSSWYRQDEGTIFADFNVPSSGSSVAGIGADTFATSLAFNTSQLIRFAGGSPTLTLGTAISGTGKMAATIKNSDYAATANAQVVVKSSLVLSLPSPTTLRIGGSYAGGSSANGHLKRISYYPKRLSDTELKSLTT